MWLLPPQADTYFFDLEKIWYESRYFDVVANLAQIIPSPLAPSSLDFGLDTIVIHTCIHVACVPPRKLLLQAHVQEVE